MSERRQIEGREHYRCGASETIYFRLCWQGPIFHCILQPAALGSIPEHIIYVLKIDLILDFVKNEESKITKHCMVQFQKWGFVVNNLPSDPWISGSTTISWKYQFWNKLFLNLFARQSANLNDEQINFLEMMHNGYNVTHLSM